MDVDELIDALIDQAFLDRRDAPVLLKMYTEVALQAGRNQNPRWEWRL